MEQQALKQRLKSEAGLSTRKSSSARTEWTKKTMPVHTCGLWKLGAKLDVTDACKSLMFLSAALIVASSSAKVVFHKFLTLKKSSEGRFRIIQSWEVGSLGRTPGVFEAGRQLQMYVDAVATKE